MQIEEGGGETSDPPSHLPVLCSHSRLQYTVYTEGFICGLSSVCTHCAESWPSFTPTLGKISEAASVLRKFKI